MDQENLIFLATPNAVLRKALTGCTDHDIMTHIANDVMSTVNDTMETVEQGIGAMLYAAAVLISDDAITDDAPALATALKEAVREAVKEHRQSILQDQNRSNADDF